MNNTNYFLIRRLHSLLGVIPLGLFLFGHLTTNSMALFGVEAFAHKVALIHSLGPLLPLVEAAMIFIPLALHIVIGIAIAITAKSNIDTLSYGRNWAYTLQRWSGWVALVFIVWHAGTLRLMDVAGAAGAADAGVAFFEYLSNQFKNPIFVGIYLLGGGAVVYHFANGLCTFCMTWGITVGPKSQQVMAVIALLVGIALMSMMLASIIGFTIHEVTDAIPAHGGHGGTPTPSLQ